MLGQAIYHLHWSPQTFWSATLHEIEAAMEAGEASSSSRDDPPDKPSPEMSALLEARRKKLNEQKTDP